MRDWDEYTQTERPALDVLERLGWDTYDPERGEQPPDNRDKLTEPLLRDRLEEALRRLNPWISDNNVGKAIRQIRNLQEPDPMQANKTIHQRLISHIALEQDRGRGRKKHTVRFIDYEDPENNDYVAISQFKVAGDVETIKPDITLFVNGIPVGVIECKKPTLTDPKEKALNQLLRYQNKRDGDHEGAERLFWYNQHTVGCWKEGAVSGTYGTPPKHYKPWRDIHPETDEQIAKRLDTDRISDQDRLLFALFERTRLLDFIQNFFVFEHEGNELKKLVARYQQHRAVMRALERIQNREEDPANGGVVWHTQGSGKSLTMLFLGLKLRKLKDNPTILVVTDRQALDRQIKATFEQCGYPNPKRARSIEDLKDKLRADAGETITTLIQKFQEHDEDEDFPVLSESEDIYVLVDEAHRTQYKTLANNMRTALPNAYYIGFTGTPIEKDQRVTTRTFGNYIDKYTIEQSIEDETTLPIKYQGRLADIHLEGANIDTIFERVFSDRSEEERAKIQQRYAKEQDLAQAPQRIKTVCLDLLEHFDSTIAEPFKGMVVTISRRAAITYKQHLDELNGPESAVIISGDHNDPEELKQYTPSDDELEQFKERFKDPSDSLKFLIVCDMLLTGFNVPICQAMYLDKPLKEHNLLQAIARVNRPFPEKSHGLVVDYYGVSEDLHKALHKFSLQEVKDAMTPIEDEKPRLEAAHRKALAYFNDVDMDDLEACVDVLEDEDTRIHFNKDFKEFSRAMDIVLPDPMANPYKDDLKRLSDIYQAAKNRFRDDSMNLSGTGQKVRNIIDEHIRSTGIEVLNQDPVSIMDVEAFDERLSDFDSDKAKASEMEHALRQEINVKHDEDPVFYESLREKLEELIEEYRQRRMDEREVIEKLEELIDEARSRPRQVQEEGLEDTAQLSIFHTLEDSLGDGLATDDVDMKDLTREITEIIDDHFVVDWKRKLSVQKEMRRDLKLSLLKKLDGIDQDQLDQLVTQVIELMREHH